MKAWARAGLAFSLHGEARARRARGERVIDAALGVLLDDAGRPVTLPTVARCLAELPPEAWLPYPAVAGEPAFLEAVRHDLTPSGLAETGEVVPTPGATGAVRTAIATCLERGDVVVTTSHRFGRTRTSRASRMPAGDVPDVRQRRATRWARAGGDTGACGEERATSPAAHQ